MHLIYLSIVLTQRKTRPGFTYLTFVIFSKSKQRNTQNIKGREKRAMTFGIFTRQFSLLKSRHQECSIKETWRRRWTMYNNVRQDNLKMDRCCLANVSHVSEFSAGCFLFYSKPLDQNIVGHFHIIDSFYYSFVFEQRINMSPTWKHQLLAIGLLYKVAKGILTNEIILLPNNMLTLLWN